MCANVLTKIAGAVVALKRSSPFAFLLAQGDRVLQSCRHTHTRKLLNSEIAAQHENLAF